MSLRVTVADVSEELPISSYSRAVRERNVVMREFI